MKETRGLQAPQRDSVCSRKGPVVPAQGLWGRFRLSALLFLGAGTGEVLVLGVSWVTR